VRLFGIQVLTCLVRHLKSNLVYSYAMVLLLTKDSFMILMQAKIFSKTNIIKILRNVPRRLLQLVKLSIDLCLLNKKLCNYLVTILLRFP
jgi:hypothetical protein